MENKENKMIFCQSCGMPLEKEEDFGTNVDGSPNGDYCAYCYRDGAFLADCTMEEMIDFCLEATKDTGLYTDREEARCQMMDWFPTFKRWSK